LIVAGTAKNPYKKYPPKKSNRDEAIDRIHERFAAMDNALSSEIYTPPERTEPLYQVPPIPQRALGVGVMVAMFHNPQLAGRITAINGDMLSVMRGGVVTEIEASRCKALIPLR
jgi:hypothetical protein